MNTSYLDYFSNLILALAGASATIASDAFMNPFDGTNNVMDLYVLFNFFSIKSDQAENAASQV